MQAISLLERGLRRTPRTSTLGWLAATLGLDPHQRQEFIAAARRRAVPAAPASPEPPPATGAPPDPTAHFVGRAAELAELDRRLRQGGRVAVHGLGGVGKTQLAARYLSRRQARYTDGAFWLRADEESSLVADLAGLAGRLGLPERELPQQDRQLAAVLRWLHDHPRWLLVLDNVEPAVQEAMDRLLPPALPGHVLLTSRTPMWPVRLALEPLPLETAREYLLRRTRQDDAAAAGAVAEALGCLPLALAQAAAYLEVTGRDLTSYGELLRLRLVDLMGEGRPGDYPRPVASTWQISFNRLEAERPAAVDLLRLCAFLAPDDIPVCALQAGAEVMPDRLAGALADDLELDRTVGAARRYSLLERVGDRMRVHRLVQAVVRQTMGGELEQTWLAAAVRLLQATYPPEPWERPEQWPLSARLLTHVDPVAQAAAALEEPPRALGDVLRRAGLYAWARGENRLATPLLRRALAIRERVLGAEHLDTGESLDDLALVLVGPGEFEERRALQERGLAIRERVLGPDHPDTALSLHNLGTMLHMQGELAAARPLYERVLSIYERALGPEHRRTAASLNNLAHLLHDEGELKRSRLLYQRALDICERVVGPDHPHTAHALNNMGRLLRDQGELEAARCLIERALAIRERVLGPDNPRTIESRSALEELGPGLNP